MVRCHVLFASCYRLPGEPPGRAMEIISPYHGGNTIEAISKPFSGCGRHPLTPWQRLTKHFPPLKGVRGMKLSGCRGKVSSPRPPSKANLVVFFITNGLSLNCPPQPEARGKRRSRSKNGIALWGQPLSMQVKRNDRCSKRLKPIKRRRLPRSGRAKERPFFGSFFGRAKKEHTPKPGAKRKLDFTKPWFRKKYYKISFKGGEHHNSIVLR